MTHSVINITCKQCNESLNGVLHDLFNTEKEYAITCPSCNKETFFNGKAAIVDSKIPEDAIEIKYVARINT